MPSFSQELESVIQIAQGYAKEYHNQSYNAAHLLKALMHKDAGLETILFSADVDNYYIEEWCEVRMETLPKVASVPAKIDADDSVKAIFIEAASVLLKTGGNELSAISVLIASVTPGVGFTFEQLKSLPITADSLIQVATSEKTPHQGIAKLKNTTNGTTKVDYKALESYCIAKNKQSQAGELKPVYGRDGELKTILEILGRHQKSNVLILGEPGVGKSIMIDGFVEAIEKGNIPEAIRGAQVFELELVDLVSGASYKSEVEDRLKKIFKALKTFSHPILVVDDIAEMIDKDNGNTGLLNILKAELLKGEVTIIGTATNDAYRKHIEIHKGFARQFELLSLKEPSEEEALTIINSIMPMYATFHKLAIDKETISEAIRLSKRFTKDRCLPDVAIDLIDRTMSATRYMIETTDPNIETIQNKVQTTIQELNEVNALKELKWQWYNLKNIFSYLLFTEIEDEGFEHIISAEAAKDEITKLLTQFQQLNLGNKIAIDKSDITSTIAHKTGIPIGKLQSDERERLLNMEEIIKTRVIGQDHAIKTISEAILESRSGLSKPGLPIGSFFFTGPTGTGKTELAKSLAEFMFQTEEAIIRFDMSEFKEEHSAALLYGAPPGYVGYEEGGVLVNKIREKPYSIVLFDEIEKAHPSVFDIFLQILDEGKLSDRLGKVGDFSNAVILFTSNIGSEHVVSNFNEGIIPKSSDLLEIMGKYFRPEFLGRLTEIVPFAPITKENVVKIFNIQLKDLHKSLQRMGISLQLTDKVTEHLAYKGFTPKYGARPLRSVIRTDLRSPLSRKIISGEVSKESNITVDLIEDQLVWNYNMN